MFAKLATYAEVINAKGYFCRSCYTYHKPEEVRHNYAISTLGEWDGNAHAPAHLVSVECPDCEDTLYMEDFNPHEWRHLSAYLEANALEAHYTYPILGEMDELLGYFTIERLDWLLVEARGWAIEAVALKAREDGSLEVLVDFC